MVEADITEANMNTPKEEHKDPRSRLADLTTRAAAKDAVKDFEAASGLYSQATELQVELNGELSTDNADLLFAYGKSLYNVAVSKSDVLGPKVAGEPQAQSSTSGNLTSAGSTTADDNHVKNAVSSGVSKKGTDEGEKAQGDAAQNQPYFQFAGDENFYNSDSEEEDNDAEAGENENEDDDDFANAFEVLDLARVLYEKKLSAVEENEGKGKSTDLSSDVRHIKEYLADTHDLQAEISLEAERFTDAVADLEIALEIKQSLYPLEDPSVAECHYKLSLALEFSSADTQKEPEQQDTNATDGGMRDKAVKHMEASIESCRIRMNQEQKKLDSGGITDEDKITAAKKRIANVKDIIADMEQRLIELRNPPASIEDQNQESEVALKSIISQVMGQSPTEQKSRLDAVAKDATDLSSFVRRKPNAKRSSQETTAATTKRSAEDAPSEEDDKKRTRMNDSS